MRGFIKKSSLMYKSGTKFRAWQQSRAIKNEQFYYENKAAKLGLSSNYTIEEIQQQLSAKLLARGIIAKPKQDKKLHIIYASKKTAWDDKNIVSALEKFANVTTYYFGDYGFSSENKTWLGIRDKMNSHFVDFIKNLHQQKPIDMVLTYFSGYRITCDVINQINDLGIITAAINYDDRLCFRGAIEGGRHSGPVDVCKAYDLNLTQAPESLIKYYAEGGIGVLWPLAANHKLYYPRKIPFKYDVSFLGSAHGNRKPFIAYLRKNGINVEAFGNGWSNGFIPDEEVPELFSSSRINLNFGDIAFTNYQCGKCRDFEIPMTGGLMLTTHNPHLANYFELDKEIFTFRNKEECVSQIHRLLSDPELCETARKKAAQRAFNEHAWEHRVESLLKIIGYSE